MLNSAWPHKCKLSQSSLKIDYLLLQNWVSIVIHLLNELLCFTWSWSSNGWGIDFKDHGLGERKRNSILLWWCKCFWPYKRLMQEISCHVSKSDLVVYPILYWFGSTSSLLLIFIFIPNCRSLDPLLLIGTTSFEAWAVQQSKAREGARKNKAKSMALTSFSYIGKRIGLF